MTDDPIYWTVDEHEKLVLAEFARYVESARSFLDHLLQEYVAKSDKLDDTGSLVLLLHRRCVCHVDAIAVQVRSGALESCPAVMRSLLEHSLSVRWLLRCQSNRLAACYRYWDLQGHVSSGTKILESRGIDTGLLEAGDQVIRAQGEWFADQTKRLKERLQDEEFSDIGPEYQKTRRGFLPWYAAFGGPRSMRALAKKLDSIHEYWMYQIFSEKMHGMRVPSTLIRSRGCVRIGSLVMY